MPPKRKSDTSTASFNDSIDDDDYTESKLPAKKRARASKASTSSSTKDVSALVASIMANPKAFDIPESEEDIRALFVALAERIQALEKVPASLVGSGRPALTDVQLDEAAEKLARVTRSQIVKLMSVSELANAVVFTISFLSVEAVVQNWRRQVGLWGSDKPRYLSMLNSTPMSSC